MKRQLALVWSNSRQPLRRWAGVDPMLGAVIGIERQAHILSCRGERVTWLQDRELWWGYYPRSR